MKTVTLRELADLVGGTVTGDEQCIITSLNSLELALPGELSFLLSKKNIESLEQTKASACIVPKDLHEVSLPVIRVENPDCASAIIHNYLLKKEFTATGIHANVVIGTDCDISEQVAIGPHVTIGDRVTIGERVVLHPGVVLGDDVRIGEDCILHANAVVSHGCILGRNVTLHHGVIIGSDGFGFATAPATGIHISKPQVGTVRIDDNVQIGANSCVDRAAFGTTRVRQGVRIDNLVMIGHNCVIGENSIIVGQAGVAGSTTLGRSVVLAAQVGVAGHLLLDDGVMVAAKAGVHNNQQKGAVIGGIPAFAVRRWGRATAAYSRLPEILKEVRRLRKEVDRMSAFLNQEDIMEKNDE